MENNNATYTLELESVLGYMIDSLVDMYPCNELTTEHLLVAILDSKKCTAYGVLNTCIASNNIRELSNIYTRYLEDNYGNNHKVNPNKRSEIKFNKNLQNILLNAEKELNKNRETKINSVHVLLSFLNPENDEENIREVFKNVGIDYHYILNRISNNSEQIKKKLNIQLNNGKPIFEHNMKNFNNNSNIFGNNIGKSDVNKKAVTSKNDYIKEYTININELVKEGKVDALVGREKEVNKIIKVLSRRKKNNAVLVGLGGVGKTSIAYGVAERIVYGNVPSTLQNKELVSLNVMSLISGTHFRGMMEERVNGLFEELKSNTKYILFIDDIQQILKTGSKEKDTDLSPMLNSILSEGDVKIIATTTFKDYRNGIEANTSLSSRFQKVIIEPCSVEESVEIIEKNKVYYEEFHHVKYPTDIIRKTVELSERYITDRSLPDSAIDVIDLTGSQIHTERKEPTEVSDARKRLIDISEERSIALNSGDFERVDEFITEENELKNIIATYNRKVETDENNNHVTVTIDDIASSISDITSIPIGNLTIDEKKKLSDIENVLKSHIIGQDEAIESVCKVIKRNKIGLGEKNKPISTQLFLGNSGTGKTLLAKKLAKQIFGSEKDLVRIDMSEYSEKSSVAKLTGAAPSYIGYENGGQLTEAIKNKQHCVLLLDEIEKANQEVFNVFLQLFDEGRLTDSAGQVVNFKNVIIIMTSNVGARQANELGKGSGFIVNETSNKKNIIEKQLKSTFAPEFLNRIDQIVYFNPLTDDNLKSIIDLELKKFEDRLKEIGYDVKWDGNVIDCLHASAIKQKEYGARPIIRLIQDNIEDNITTLILNNDYEDNYCFSAKVENDVVVVE